jgi:putative hemolysin
MAASEPAQIMDQLIAERTIGLSKNPLWPIVRPFLYRFFNYPQAVAMAEAVSGMSGYNSLAHISDLLKLDITVSGLDRMPRSGAFILAPTHPTGIPDGIAVFDIVKNVRRDFAIFANRDAIRVNERFRDHIIPVEWRPDQKTRAKSRDTLEMTARAFADGKAIILFASGRIAYWHEDRLTERPWQTSLVSLARRYNVPVVPANITARNSGLFYLLSKYSTELRDMTLFHELLNKKSSAFTITVGHPIPAAELDGDQAEVTARLQYHAEHELRANPDARFAGIAPLAAAAA